MKYVFVSLPMNDRSDKDIGHRLCSINGAVKKACVEKFGWEWDDILTIDNFWDQVQPDHVDLPDFEVKNSRIFYIGGALQKMARADAVYFDEGWECSTGCQIEFFTAINYERPVLFYSAEYGGKKDEEKEE